jgi:hypothetical protein
MRKWLQDTYIYIYKPCQNNKKNRTSCLGGNRSGHHNRPLHCLSFFELWFPITPLISSHFSICLLYTKTVIEKNILHYRFVDYEKSWHIVPATQDYTDIFILFPCWPSFPLFYPNSIYCWTCSRPDMAEILLAGRFVLFNRNTTGVTSGAGTANLFGAPEFTPGFYWASCCSNFSFLCNVL